LLHFLADAAGHGVQRGRLSKAKAGLRWLGAVEAGCAQDAGLGLRRPPFVTAKGGKTIRPRKTRGLLCPVVRLGWGSFSDGSTVVLLEQLRGLTHGVKNGEGSKAVKNTGWVFVLI
jgi:hypothetical protein